MNTRLKAPCRAVYNNYIVNVRRISRPNSEMVKAGWTGLVAVVQGKGGTGLARYCDLKPLNTRRPPDPTRRFLIGRDKRKRYRIINVHSGHGASDFLRSKKGLYCNYTDLAVCSGAELQLFNLKEP